MTDLIENFDSEKETVKHILRINELLHLIARDILNRADKHDRSKLLSPEKEMFDKFTPKLKNSVYGSNEYKGFLEEMKETLDHHYSNNKSHHPNAHKNGIDDMNLIDMIEMFIDWKASSERHDTGDIFDSIELNKTRFNMSEQLVNLFKNTVDYLDLAKPLTIIIDTPLTDDFIFLEDNVIKDLKEKFGLEYYHNNCLPMYEKTKEEFLFNCRINGSNWLQYSFKLKRSEKYFLENKINIEDYLKNNSYVNYSVWKV